MRIEDLGLISYADALARQKERLAEVEAGGEETLFLLEHQPVITFGRHGGEEFLHLPEPVLRQRGVEVAKSERGGKVTCHFPGQVVAYPIFRVARRPGGLRAVFDGLEDAAVAALADAGVAAHRRDGYPGVWTERGKIASVGLAVKRWITYHGLALNVGPGLSLFEAITLCGLPDATATSVALERGDEAVTTDKMKELLGERIRGHFTDSALAAGQTPAK
ncbi:lipoyl(octanoyl) transferase LipB [Desulfohalovibrio reitneri]|uniref:lipoyl(octanoyl) transferase LipB n=1 Tax=Desulfohalovibrio reitneri TaxID=1307759 RepID=UPI0004A77331|nr:lipoyl(octanoyl) transferase LipB [Desulfohalovibrio reitneri]